MAKQLNVNLAFTADTSQAKAQIQSLQTQLKAITSLNPTTAFGGTLTKQIQEASMAATQLQVHLKNATNVNTGTLDFTKLNQSLQKSQTNLSSYANKLLAIGPQGQQAFMSLAQAVASAEIPIRRSTGMLAEMGTVLKNTARWQISSSILHGFMGAIQSAYGYAQDLNESLNNIRIVTGQNIDQMAKFAENANKAAKALSTTTTAYTNAALIYYQQGDTDQQVLEKTDVTVKMANVIGQDATTVSEQLTAIWNNFNKAGDVAYEHYADILTALGAETASSTDEIAGGLEKFAAVAETIGLSYEYATAALTTITAMTRQSEDVVGTALKTIFARIQGLNLGETLDDGTTLNKYSEALQKVGINIFDQAGELKQMDTILDEMGSKWDTLSKAQQVALAQSVAGVRQYNQLISLMDNWGYMQENLQTAYNATGALDRQAEIYAESWDAAEKRVKAAAQGIYQSLLNDEFFIDLNNLFADLLEGLDGFIDKIGGVKSVLLMLGAIVTKVFSTQIANGLSQAATSMSLMTERGREKVRAQQADFVNQAANTMAKQASEGLASEAVKAQAESYKQQLQLQSKLITNADRLSEEEMQVAQILMDQVKARQEAEIEARKTLNAAKTESGNKKLNLFSEVAADRKAGSDVSFNTLQKTVNPLSRLVKRDSALASVSSQIMPMLEDKTPSIDNVKKKLEELKNAAGNNNILDKVFDQLLKEAESTDDAIDKVKEKLQQLELESATYLETAKSNVKKQLNRNTNSNPITDQHMDDYIAALKKTEQADFDVKNAEDAKKFAMQQAQDAIDKAIGTQKRWSDIVAQSANVFMNFGMGLSMISNMINQLKSPDVSGWDKFLTVLTTIGMVIPSMVSTWGTLKSLISKETAAKVANTFATMALTKAERELQETKNGGSSKVKKSIKRQRLERKSKWNQTALNTYLSKTDSGWTELGNGKINANGQILTRNNAAKLAGKEATAAMGKMAGGFALIAAAVALVGGTIYVATKHVNAAKEAAESAQKSAQALKEDYQKLQEEQNNFSSSLDQYKNGVDGLKDLTKGTLEYQKALMETNSQALELISNNKELSGKYSIKDGVITFDEEALEDFQKKQMEKTSWVQSMSILGDSVAQQSQSDYDRQQFARKSLKTSGDFATGLGNSGVGLAVGGAGAALGIAGAAAAGATIGSIVPIIGPIIGAAVGIIGAGITTAIIGTETKAESEAIDKLIDYVEENGNSLFAESSTDFTNILKNDIKIEDEDLIKSLYDNKESLDQLTAVEIARAQKEVDDFELAFISAAMAGNAEFANLKLGQNYLAAIAGQEYGQVPDEISKKVDNLSNKELAEYYLKYVLKEENVNGTTGETHKYTTTGGKGMTQWTLVDGNWESGGKDSFSVAYMNQQVKKALSMNEALSSLDVGQADLALSQLEDGGLSLDDDSKLIDKILVDFIKQKIIDFSEFSPEEIFDIDTEAIGGDLGQKINDSIVEYRKNMSILEKEIYDSDWYQNLSEEDKRLVWTINFNSQDSLNKIKDEVKYLQDYADSQKITLATELHFSDEIETAVKAGDSEKIKEIIKGTLPEGITDPDTRVDEIYQKMLEQGSLERQQAYLENLVGVDSAAATTLGGSLLAKDVIKQAEDKWQNSITSLENAKERKQKGQEDANRINQQIEDEKNLSDYEYAVNVLGMTGLTPEEERLASGNSYKGSLLERTDALEKKIVIEDLARKEYLGEEASVAFGSARAQIGMASNRYNNQVIDLDPFLKLKNLGFLTQEEYDDIEYRLNNKEYIGETTANYVTNILNSKQQQRKNSYIDSRHSADLEAANAEANIDLTNATNDVTKYKQEYQAALQETLNTYERGLISIANKANIADEEWNATVNFLKDNQDYAEKFKDIFDYSQDDPYLYEIGLKEAALNISLMAQGAEELKNNWDKWHEVLTNSSISLTEILTMLPALTSSLSKIFRIDQEFLLTLSPEFYQKNAELINQIYLGVEGAIEKFQLILGQQYLLSLELEIDDEHVKRRATAILNTISAIINKTPLTFGMKMDEVDDRLVKYYQKLIQQLGLTTEQAIEYLNAQGWSVSIDINGKLDWEDAYYRGANETNLFDYTPSDLEDFEPAKLEDAIERYKEINDRIDDITDAYDKASKAADRLYGAERINALQEANNLLEKEIDLTKQKRIEAEQYLKADKIALQNLGFEVQFDNSGNVTNATDIMSDLVDQLNKAGDSNGDGKVSEDEKKAQEEVQKKIDKFKEALSLYDETRELIVDLDKEATDKFYQWQDNNYQMLTESLENATKPLERQLKQIDFYIKRLGDSFYHTAARGEELQKKFQITQEKISAYQNSLNDLLASRSDIGEKNFSQGIEQFIDDNLSEMENLLNYKEEMENFYKDAFASANEEIEKYTDKIEHLNSVLGHYNDLLALFGEEENFEAQRTILEAQESIANNSYEIAKNTYALMAEQEVALKRQLDQAIAAGADEETIELYTKYWEDAAEATREAEDKMLESAKEWAEAIKATFENTLKELNKGLEKALSGGTSFDVLSTQMERRQSLQEEYLTTTNKIYETNKLINSAQQEIDKTSNTVAKNRMKNFIRETQQLQKQGELSQFELDIQQAKYDLLLAEIALEEAQNAKSTVTLQRDREGNFGYVYTADSSAVAQAQQEFDNAQNALYNIGLEGANKYTESYTQTLQEMYDKLAEIQQQRLDGYFQTEQEYEDAILAAKEFYYKKLEQYSSLYTTAVTVDSNIIADAWSTDFANMVYDTENWKDEVNHYLEETREAFGDFEDQMSVIRNETVGEDLDALAEKTNNITKKSKDLTTEITKSGGLLDSLGQVFLKAQGVAEAFGSIAAQIENTIKNLQGLNEDAEGSLVQNPNPSGNSSGNENPPGSPGGSSGVPSGNGGPSGNSGGNGGSSGRFGAGRDITKGDNIEKIYDKIYQGTYGNGTKIRLQRALSDGFTADDYWAAQHIIDYVFGRGYAYSRARELLKFDTGGYTGDWNGPYGKLALLHQKELVLNAEDTKNLLASVEVLDSILKTMDLYNIQMASLASPSVETGHSDTLEQNVHIEANFPNATDHSEIEQAFDNLINLASQYANRK